MGAPLKIGMFGPMQVHVGDAPLPTLRSRKALWLLGLMTLRSDRPVSREWVASTLWPDSDQGVAFANLRPVLSELRRALGDQAYRLRSPDRATVFLDLDGAEVDLLEFDAAISRGDYLRAVELYGGPLLEGCLEAWLLQERNARLQDCTKALQSLGDAAYEKGLFEEAIERFSRLTILDPWRDAPRRGLMKAFMKAGDANGALQTYRDFAHTLRAQGGLLPDEKTTALYHQIRGLLQQGARPPKPREPEAGPPKVVGYLPHALTALIGREDERTDVTSKLRQNRLVTLLGTGGIGKTRLAMEVAKDVSREFPDGVWLVPLEALTDERLVVGHLISTLKITERPDAKPLENLVDGLRKKRSLLVLDNCEHLLLAVVELSGKLLRECGGIHILATSREALGIIGERVWPVPALPTPDRDHLPQNPATLLRVVASYEGVQLFLDRTKAVNPAFELSGENAVVVAEICARLEGVPLAIELAAARMKAMTAAQVGERLTDHLRLLTGGDRSGASRQRTLRATLDWSYELLNPEERTLFRRLSVFAGGWTLDAAERICADDDLDRASLGDLHHALTDKSIVGFDERSGRFRFLETVRQYAQEKLDASGERETLRARHGAWCLELARLAEQHYRGPEQKTWLDRLEAETPNFRAVLGADDVETALQLAGALGRYWMYRGPFAEGLFYCERALSLHVPPVGTAGRAKVLESVGALAMERGDGPRGKAAYQEALEIRRALGEPLEIVAALSGLALVAAQEGDLDLALKLHEESLPLIRQRGEWSRYANTLRCQAAVYFAQSEFERANEVSREAIAMSQASNDEIGVSLALCCLAEGEIQLGRYEGAELRLADAMELCRKLRYANGLAWTLDISAYLKTFIGAPERAWELHEQALSIFEELGHPYGIAASHAGMGAAAFEMGWLKDARRLLEEGIRRGRPLNDPRVDAARLTGLALVATAEGALSEALAYLEEAMVTNARIGDPKGAADSLLAAGAAWVRQGDFKLAAVLFGAAAAAREKLQTPLHPVQRVRLDPDLAAVRANLSTESFEACTQRGAAMTWREALDYALNPAQI